MGLGREEHSRDFVGGVSIDAADAMLANPGFEYDTNNSGNLTQRYPSGCIAGGRGNVQQHFHDTTYGERSYRKRCDGPRAGI